MATAPFLLNFTVAFCIADYDTENPRIVTKCKHHFHLSCILEWMERSDTCPICDQVLIITSAPFSFLL